MPESGNVARFLASGELVRGGPSALSAALGGGGGVCLARGSGGGVKRFRLYRKTPAHLARQGLQGSRFVPGFGRGLGIHRVLIMVFLVLSF